MCGDLEVPGRQPDLFRVLLEGDPSGCRVEPLAAEGVVVLPLGCPLSVALAAKGAGRAGPAEGVAVHGRVAEAAVCGGSLDHPTHRRLLTRVYAECTQTGPDGGGHRRSPTDAKAAVTCGNVREQPSTRRRDRNVSPAHNPEVAGSNPAPATSEVAGQRPFLPSGRQGLWRSRKQSVSRRRRRTLAHSSGQAQRRAWGARGSRGSVSADTLCPSHPAGRAFPCGSLAYAPHERGSLNPTSPQGRPHHEGAGGRGARRWRTVET